MKKYVIVLLSLFACCLYADETFDDVSYLYGPSDVIPGVYAYRARGTSRDKEVIGSSDTIMGFFGNGYKGATGFTPYATPRVGMYFQAAENWSSTANGTKILFKTTPLTTAVPATALTIAGGEVTIGTSLFTLPSNAAPKTNVTPTAVGQLIYNSTANQLCVSTGTALNTWVQVADGTTACSN